MTTRSDGTIPIIAHGSVYLRAVEREDLPRFVAWLNDYATSRTLALRTPLSLPLEERWFEGLVEDGGRHRQVYVACRVEDDRPIGNVGLEEIDLLNGSAAIGLMIGEARDRGRGHGSDMLLAILGHGFDSLRLERIWLDVYDFNVGARRLYERLGFVHEGTLRHAVFREGRYVDVHRLSMLAGEWRARRDAAAAEP